MINPKDILKEFGARLRSSNPGHQTALRQQLAERGNVQVKPAPKPLNTYLFFGAWSFVLLALVVVTRPSTNQVALEPKPQPPIYADSATEAAPPAAVPKSDDYILGSAGEGFGSLTTVSNSLTETGASADEKTIMRTPTDKDVVDYTQNHGQMLDTSTDIGLMTTERDLSTDIARLFEGFGGHVNSISTITGTGQIVTGLVPADSYFLLKEQLRSLVHGDQFIRENLNAEDLTSSAVTIDQQIETATKSIDDLQAKLDATKNTDEQTRLKNQISTLNVQRENLHKSKSSLESDVAYTSVAVSVTAIPGFAKARTINEFKQLVAGFETPGVFEQIEINALVGLSYLLQAFSYTFWLLIPLGIWLVSRARTRRAWRGLD